jgi:hypothetical protein
MAYFSKRPTTEKKRLYHFMERHKVQGKVSIKKISDYGTPRGFTRSKGDYAGKKLGTLYTIYGKKGRKVAEVAVKKKSVHWWVVE